MMVMKALNVITLTITVISLYIEYAHCFRQTRCKSATDLRRLVKANLSSDIKRAVSAAVVGAGLLGGPSESLADKPLTSIGGNAAGTRVNSDAESLLRLRTSLEQQRYS